MREIIGLARIQQIDTRIDQSQLRILALDSRIENNKELLLLSNVLTELKDRLSNARKHLESSERKLQENSNKLEQSEATLYSGKIKNPKELQDIEKEIFSLNRMRVVHEEKLLNDMMTYEELTKDLENASQNFQAAELNFNQLMNELLNEKQSIQEELSILLEEKNVAEKSLSDEAINIYNKLRKSKKGLAVSSVSDGVCNSCGSTLTPSKQQSIKSSDELLYCSTCGRLLYSQ